MMISCDDHVWPAWAPEWLRAQVESPIAQSERIRGSATWPNG